MTFAIYIKKAKIYYEERISLEAIMIQVIKDEIFKGLGEQEKKGSTLCIVGAPTLIEHGIVV